jgi:hypothetical protein
VPKVNIESDYEQSKEFSTPDGDSTSPQSEVSDSLNLGSSFNAHESESELEQEGNPEKFRAMAQEVAPETDESS